MTKDCHGSGLRVLILGSGGREHAIAQKLSQSSRVEQIFVAPGNGGTCTVAKAKNLAIQVTEFSKLSMFAIESNVNIVIPGPEEVLLKGAEREFRKIGIPCFGPSVDATMLEASKIYGKNFMVRNKIPTATFEIFSDPISAKEYINSIDFDVVVKANGLAAGKGVLIPKTKEEALNAIDSIMIDKEFGDAGTEIIIEECLQGQELSVLTICDGYTTRSFPTAQDHKRALNNDLGLNTGGMGCYAPTPIATPMLIKQIDEEIIKPTIEALRIEKTPFVGVLFTGIMVTKEGPKVLEYNTRFGDPETQTVLPLLDSDFAEIILATVERRLDSVEFKISDKFSCTVCLTAGGYPKDYRKGDCITMKNIPSDISIFHAGTKLEDGQLLTNGGRVLSVNACDISIKAAVERAYQAIKCISFKDCHFRDDIAYNALNYKKDFLTYEKAGVSISTGNSIVEKIKPLAKSTARRGCEALIGGFGGFFDLDALGYKIPVLVAATDGVGTKLLLAQQMKKHDTVGIDLVAMNVNDLVVQGAEPLMFLDYYASASLNSNDVISFVSGVAKGCIEANCALVGGETSEMPGMYIKGHFDVNGTAIGIAEKAKILPRMAEMIEGDVVIGIASDGIHSNGYSLVRKIIEGVDLSQLAPWDNSSSIGEFLLKPTRIYVKPVLKLIKIGLIKGAAHITGGGLEDNIPRALPKHLCAQIKINSWKVPACFEWLQEKGNVPRDDMFKTFNMGIGMALIVGKNYREAVFEVLARETVFEIGQLVARVSDGFEFV